MQLTKERVVELTQGYEAIVDASDFALLSLYNWQVAKNRNGKPYARGVVKGKQLLMHRFIMSCPDDMQVDHINGNGLDNRRCNLRICTQSQNQHNKNYKNKSGYKGVFKVNENRYTALIQVNKQKVYLGSFDSALKAHNALENYRNSIPVYHCKQETKGAE